MEKTLRRRLQKKQALYTNIIYLIYILIVLLFILSRASAFVVYSILGIIFLLSPISLWLTQHPNPLLLLFPGMKPLIDDEKERLGDVGRTYYLSGALLQLALSGFCFVQAFLRGTAPFIEGIPWWYWFAAALALFYIGNLNLRFHHRRLDQKSQEELAVYAKDRALFSVVFASVFLFFVVVGAMIVFFFVK